MANRYCTREAVKVAANISGIARDSRIDSAIDNASREIETDTRRFFIPRTETRLYRFPPVYLRSDGSTDIVWLDQDLLSITTLQTKAQDSSPTTIASSDFFTEPNNPGPDGQQRFDRIEIDQSSSAAFEGGATPQRSISVAGDWGWDDNTQTVDATLAEDLDTSETGVDIDDSSDIEVGHTILVGSERMEVTNRTFIAPGSAPLLDGALTATKNQVAITIDSGHAIVAGETVLVDSERMFVESVTATTMNVVRGYDGTTLAAHSDDTALQVPRRLTVIRGANGSTAATASTSDAIAIYVVNGEVQELCLAVAIAAVSQGSASYGRQIGTGDGAREMTGKDLASLRKRVVAKYQRPRIEAI